MKDKKLKIERNKDFDYYVTFSQQLEKANRNLEKELEKLRSIFGAERLRLEERVKSLINEIDRLREPPLVVAVVVKIHEETGKVIVLSSTGPMFVVAPSRKVKNKKIEPGMFVSLNQRTFAIMEILSLTKEDIRSAKSKIYKEY